MNIATSPPSVDSAAILRAARNRARHHESLRTELLTLSGPWLSRKLDDPQASLSQQEALRVQSAISLCVLRAPEMPVVMKPAPKPKKVRSKAKAAAVSAEAPATPPRAVPDVHFLELMRLAHYKGRDFGRMLQAELTPKARSLATNAIVSREGIHAHGTFTRLLSNQLEWTEVYLRDVMQAMGLSARELLALAKRSVRA